MCIISATAAHEMVLSFTLPQDFAESIAKRNLAEILHAYELSELFEEYWSVQFQKIELLNDRLTSLNILKNHEVKVGGHV